jgi:hypothetical protein
MPVAYEVRVDPMAGQPAYRICWRRLAAPEENSFSQAEHHLTREEAERLWLMPAHHHALGQKLFRFLDGDARHLTRGLEEAAKLSEPLILYLRAAKQIADWPFELLAQDGAFLLPSRLHLRRQVSDWGAHKTSAPANRLLQLLFMACSALDVKPELDFEREEETIFRVTEKLAIDMEVEDSGSRTGETPAEQAAASFAQQLVEQFHVPGVLSWGRSVSDQQATVAEQFIYRELSRGRDLLSAVQRARQELLEHFHAAPAIAAKPGRLARQQRQSRRAAARRRRPGQKLPRRQAL